MDLGIVCATDREFGLLEKFLGSVGDFSVRYCAGFKFYVGNLDAMAEKARETLRSVRVDERTREILEKQKKETRATIDREKAAAGMKISNPPEKEAMKHVDEDLRDEALSAAALAAKMERAKTAGRDRVVVVKCGVGKVAAAMTATILITYFGCDQILLLGTAGALQDSLMMADVVVADGAVQHDFDARPFVERHVVIPVGTDVMPVDPDMAAIATVAARKYLEEEFKTDVGEKVYAEICRRRAPAVTSGIVLSGDVFVHTEEVRAELKTRLPLASCIEMEGAAIAQVCMMAQARYCIVRTISDGGNDNAFSDFETFCDKVAGHITLGVVRNYLALARELC